MHGVGTHPEQDTEAEGDKEKLPSPGVQDAHQFMHNMEDTDHVHEEKPNMNVEPRGTRKTHTGRASQENRP